MFFGLSFRPEGGNWNFVGRFDLRNNQIVEFCSNFGSICCGCLLSERFFAVNEAKIDKGKDKRDSYGKECERAVDTFS